MKDNIDNSLYKAFHDREYPSDKVRESIHIKITEMEENEIKENEIKRPEKNKTVQNRKIFSEIKADYVRRIAITGAALILILFLMIATNVGGVKASIQKIFAFIPGIGIVKVEDNSIVYCMKGDSQTKGNGNYEIKLDYIYVSKDSVCVTWEIILKNASNFATEEKVPLFKKMGCDKAPEVKLVVGDKIYESGSDLYAGETSCTAWIDVSDVNWNLADVYQVIYQDMSFDFSLQDYETYMQAEDIGPTQRLNDISITAIPEWEDGSVTIALYNLNYSSFDSLGGYKSLLSQETPYLTIGDTIIRYEKIYTDRGKKKMLFDLSGIELTKEHKATAVFHIPTIEVRKKEDKKLGITRSKDGSYHASQESIQFSNSTMHIISVEKATRVDQYNDFENCLKLTLKMDYNMKNLELENFSKIELNKEVTGGWACSCDYEEDTGYYSLYIQDYAETSKIKTISFDELTYFINEEYHIDLGK